MSYKFFDDISIADMAFEATGKDVNELFESAALAVTNTMVKDLEKVKPKVKKRIKKHASDIQTLLYDFLQEIIYIKDADKLFFSKFDIQINKNHGFELECTASGEKIDPKTHKLGVDVKAVTMHKYEVKQGKNSWRAFVVLDI